MLKICLVFWESEPRHAYKRYAYKKKHVTLSYQIKYVGLYLDKWHPGGVTRFFLEKYWDFICI